MDWSWFVHVSRNDRHEIPCPRLPPVAPGCLGSRRSLSLSLALLVFMFALWRWGTEEAPYVKPHQAMSSHGCLLSFPCHSHVIPLLDHVGSDHVTIMSPYCHNWKMALCDENLNGIELKHILRPLTHPQGLWIEKGLASCIVSRT